MRKDLRPIVSIRNRWRHPCDRAPWWLNQLAEEIRYWLRSTSRKRHSEPFNKRPVGYRRRQERRFKLQMRNPEL